MDEIGRIFLSWRKGPSTRRYIVGVIKRNATDGETFSYFGEEVAEASKEGFKPYIDFPNTNVTYTENVLSIFGQRLIKPERTDISGFIDFWDLEPSFIHNQYYLLAHTQGWLPTDTFEFLAEFYPVKGFKFVTDLAGISHNDTPRGLVKAGDKLTFVKETENAWDKYAVLVLKDNHKIGYIKKIHNKVFHHSTKSPLKIVAKRVEENGKVQKIFVEILH